MERQRFDPIKYTNSPEGREILSEWKYQGVQGEYRRFEEEKDAGFIKMRLITIWEAQETMERGVSERDNPSTFLAQTIKRR
jgi:hypothetical protein